MSLIVKLGMDTRNFDKEMKKLTKDISTVSNKFSEIGKSLTQSVTIPLGIAGGAVVKFGSEFEASMSALAAVTNASGTELEALQNKAMEMGSNTKYSAKEAADAMTELAKAGMDSNKTMEAIPGVLAMAATENMELAEAASITSAILNGYNLSANDSARVADVLAKNSNMSASGVQSLGAAIAPVAGFASNLGISFEDLNASLGIMSNSGIDGAVAGEKLMAILRSLAAPSDVAEKQMKALGLSVFDASGKMKPLPAVIDDVNKATAGMGDQQKMAALKTMFGTEAMAALLPLMKAGGAGITDYSKQLQDSGGFAEDTANKINNNLKGSLDQLSSAAETAAISLYQNIGPALKEVVDGVTKLVSAFAELSPDTQKIIVVFASLAAAIGPMIFIGAKMAMAFGKISAAIKVARAATTMWGAATALAGGPVTLIVLAIVALIAIIALLVIKWDVIKAATISVWNSICSFFSSVWNSITSACTEAGDSISSGITSVWNAITGFFSGIWASITNMFTSAWTWISTGVVSAFTAIKDFFAQWGLTILAVLLGPIGILALTIYKNWDAIKAAAIAVWTTITAFLVGVWNGIVAFVTPIFNAIATFLSSVWNGIMFVVMAIWNYITQYLVAIWTALLYLLTPIFQSIANFLIGIWNGIKNIAISVWLAISGFLTTVWNGIVSIATTVWNALKSFFIAWLNGILSVITTVWNAIKAVVTTVWNGIVSVATTIWNALKAFFIAWLNGIKNVITTIWNAIVSVVTAVWTSLVAVATSIWIALKNAIMGPVNSLKASVTSAFNSLKSQITSVWNSIKSTATSIWNGITSSVIGTVNGLVSGVKGAFSGLKGAVVGVWEGIKSGIRSAINGIISLINKFINAFNAPARALNSLPGVNAPTIPNVPMLATGGTIFGNGQAIVGEAGPELVSKSGSSVKVTPLSSGEKASGIGGALGMGNGFSGTIEVPVTLDGQVIAKVVAPFMDTELRSKRDQKIRARGGW